MANINNNNYDTFDYDNLQGLLQECNGDPYLFQEKLEAMKKRNSSDNNITDEPENNQLGDETVDDNDWIPCDISTPSFVITASFNDSPKNLDQHPENTRFYKQNFSDKFIENQLGLSKTNKKNRNATYMIGAKVIAVRNDFSFPLGFNTAGLYANNPSIDKNGNCRDFVLEPTEGEISTKHVLTQVPKSRISEIMNTNAVPYNHTLRNDEIDNCVMAGYNENLKSVSIHPDNYCAGVAQEILEKEGSGETSKGQFFEDAVWLDPEILDKAITIAKNSCQKHSTEYKLLDFNNIGFSIERADGIPEFCAPSSDNTMDSLVQNIGEHFIGSDISSLEDKKKAYIKIQINTCVKKAKIFDSDY